MKEFLSRVWCRLLRLFADCDVDLFIAAHVLKNFSHGEDQFERALVGFGYRYEDGGWCHDAVSYLAASGRFYHIGLSFSQKHQRLIPRYRSYTMCDAVRHAFRLSEKEFKYLFDPRGYPGDICPRTIATRIERFAVERKIHQ